MTTRLVSILVAVFALGCNQKAEKKDPSAAEPAATAPATSPTAPASPGAATPAAPASDDGPALDACSLLTAADIEAATRQKSTDPKPVADNGPAVPGMKMASCTYAFAKDPQVPLVKVSATTFASADAAAKFVEFQNQNNPTLEKLSGIGDAAHWRPEGTAAEFRKGRYQVDIDVNDSEDRDAAIALAKKAAAKVP